MADANDGNQEPRTQLVKAISDPGAALTDGSLATLAAAKLIDVSAADAAKLRRYEALRQLSVWSATAYLDGPPS